MWTCALLWHKSVTTSLFPCEPPHPHCARIRSSHGQATVSEEALKDSVKISLEPTRAAVTLTIFMQNNVKEKPYSLIWDKYHTYSLEHISHLNFLVVVNNPVEGGSYFCNHVTQVSTVCKSRTIRHYPVRGARQPAWYLPAWSDMRCKIYSIVVTKPATLASLLCGQELVCWHTINVVGSDWQLTFSVHICVCVCSCSVYLCATLSRDVIGAHDTV